MSIISEKQFLHKMDKKVYNKRSSVILEDGSPKLPTADQLAPGEIAINYAAGVETLSIKNSNDEVIALSLNAKAAADILNAHQARNDNPHQVTKEQVGLDLVDNTSDIEKPISTLQQAALDKKLEKDGVINNLTTNDSTKALSAAQGIALKKEIEKMSGSATADLTALQNRVSTVEEEISTALNYIDNTLQPKAEEFENLTV